MMTREGRRGGKGDGYLGSLNSSGMAKEQEERNMAHDCQGVEAPWPLAFSQKSTQQGHQNRTMPRFGGELREDKAGKNIRRWTCDWQTPQGPKWTWVQAEGGNGRSKPARERQQTQAHDAGRRDEMYLLTGGKWGLCPGGQRLEPGEEVGRGCKLRGLQRGAATDVEEVRNRGKITTQKTGEEKGWAEGLDKE